MKRAVGRIRRKVPRVERTIPRKERATVAKPKPTPEQVVEQLRAVRAQIADGEQWSVVGVLSVGQHAQSPQS